MEKLNQLLLNRVAIITGGTRGIIWVLPGFWGQAGAEVVLVYRSDNQRANEAIEELKKEWLRGYIYSRRCRHKERS